MRVSTDIEIKKEVEITIQIDHVSCFECGEWLEHKVDADNFGSLQIKVNPCKCVLEDEQ